MSLHGSPGLQNSASSQQYDAWVGKNLIWCKAGFGVFSLHIPAYSVVAKLYRPGIELVIAIKTWDEITYPFLNFNGRTVEV